MNTYKTQFFAKCPANGVRISYDLTINTGSVIKVEDLIDEVGSIGEGLHEQIADRLHSKFGGSQVLKADHHGVRIETIRPHLAHWSKDAPCPTNSPPASQEQSRWAEYVAGIVDHWVESEWPHYIHMGEDRRVKAIAGIIERRLWALKREPARHEQADTIAAQEAWEAAGGNPGIKATKVDLLAALRMMDEVCDKASQEQAEPAAQDHIPEAGKMLNGFGQAETDASASVSGLTVAPVGERLTLSAEDVHAAFVKHFPKTRISQAWIGFAAEIAEAIAARAAPSASDAVDAERYRYLRAVGGQSWHEVSDPRNPKLVTGSMYDVATDAAMRKGQL